MSKYDEAIYELECIEHTESKWPGTEDKLAALDLALSALRDAAERAKGCEYCNPDNIDYYYAGNVPNYCKHCGRDLTKEAQG